LTHFVAGFYQKLIDLGVNVSIDELDIIPGDNFPRVIFEECIDNCENFIVILSPASIASKWVNEELDAGMIQKIEKGARLIPVVIDNLPVDRIPNRLRHLAYYKINDVTDYETDAERIANICLGNYERPEPKAPKIEPSRKSKNPSLNTIDARVFEKACEIAMEEDNDFIGVDKLIERLSNELSYDEIKESIEVLDSKLYFKIQRTIFSKIENYNIELDTQAIMIYLDYGYEGIDKLLKSLASYIQAKGDIWMSSRVISDELKINHFLLRKLLDRFENKGYILSSKSNGQTVTFRCLVPGNRYFREILS